MLIGPAFHRFEFVLGAEGKAEIEMTRTSAVLDQHHQQPIATGDQPDRFQLRLGAPRPRDQTHQAREIGESARQLQQQIVKSRPAQAEARELPFKMLHGNARLRQQAVHVMAIAQRAWNSSG